MKHQDFDIHAVDYNLTLQEQLAFFDQDESYFAEYKIKIIKSRVFDTPARILEYGCGVGRNLPHLHRYFPKAEISGCDISGESLRQAKKFSFVKLYHLGTNEIREKFDIIFVSCVFHHVEPGMRKSVAVEIHRLLNDGGCVFVFEHNPYNPVTRRLVDRCPFDAGVALLSCKELGRLFADAGFRIVKREYSLFFPSALRVFRPVERWLGWLPLGGQYFIQFTTGPDKAT